LERDSQTIVVDASVVIKWFIPEPDSNKAVKLRDRHIEGSLTLIAPDLLVYEVANALSNHPDLSVDEIKQDLEALLMLDLDLIQPSGEFVSLAKATSSSLITADRKLCEKAKKAGLALTLDEYDDA
jgi:predicted nucleic acid-binding protein